MDSTISSNFQNHSSHDLITAYLKRSLSSDLEVEAYEQLSKRASRVVRAQLKKGPFASLIIKHLPDLNREQPPSRTAELREEQLAYVFLKKHPGVEKFAADLLGFENGKILALEDLGKPAPDQRQESLLPIVPRLAEALAHLHGSTYGQQVSYLELRREMGLGLETEDMRRYGKPNMELLYKQGQEYLLHRFDISFVRHYQDKLSQTFDGIFESIQKPGKFLSFIHDDLGNARQTFPVGDKLFLLDFEYAKFTHMLLDFVKPIIGKFEMNHESLIYTWMRPSFPLELIALYRQQLAHHYHITFDETEWKQAQYHALAFGAICLVGRLCFLEPEKKLYGTVKDNMKGILHRLQGLLEELDEGHTLQQFIAAYLKEA